MSLMGEQGEGTFRLGPPPRRRERMEFALPTINVIFLLMLYFLVAGTIVQKNELSVLPPVTTAVATDRLPRPLLVISEEGTLLLDGVPVTAAELIPAATAAVADPNLTVPSLNVLAPAGMAADPFLAIVASLGAAGVPVRIVTVEAKDAAP